MHAVEADLSCSWVMCLKFLPHNSIERFLQIHKSTKTFQPRPGCQEREIYTYILLKLLCASHNIPSLIFSFHLFFYTYSMLSWSFRAMLLQFIHELRCLHTKFLEYSSGPHTKSHRQHDLFPPLSNIQTACCPFVTVAASYTETEAKFLVDLYIPPSINFIVLTHFWYLWEYHHLKQ